MRLPKVRRTRRVFGGAQKASDGSDGHRDATIRRWPAPGHFELHALTNRHRLTSYDALYLDAALATGLPLATCDNALRQAAQECGFGNPRFWAGLVAIAVAARWRNTLLTIASGFAAFWLINWIL
jgi:hypothetical protein